MKTVTIFVISGKARPPYKQALPSKTTEILVEKAGAYPWKSWPRKSAENDCGAVKSRCRACRAKQTERFVLRRMFDR